jgi:ABC-2 type transport system ATP-binding protein
MSKAVELREVSKAFGKKVLYENASIQIEEGECVGFIGGNGAGKSVLFQLMTGLLPVDAGEVIINGKKLGREGDFPEDVGIFINAPGYIEYESGFKNLQMLAQIQGKINDDEVKAAMRLVGLDPMDKTKVKKYSMGMKQKLGIAQAIMEHQRIIILDEPYNALDFNTNKEITKVLKELKQEGRTILLTSHQQEYLDKLCDKMYCIENGKLEIFDREKKEAYFSAAGF